MNRHVTAVAKWMLPKALYDRAAQAHWDRQDKQRSGPRRNTNTQEYWNGIWAREGVDTRDNGRLHGILLDLVPDGSSVIDVGCGNGQMIRKLITEKKAVCTALDMSDVVLQMLRKEFQVETVQTLLPTIPCPDEHFDVAICSQCLEHLDQPGETVAEMHRIVREGGRLIVSVPDGCIWGRGGEHIQEFTPTDCVNLLRPYVRDVHLVTLVSQGGWPGLVVWGDRTRERPQYAAELRSHAGP